jgi:hypothetical protein
MKHQPHYTEIKWAELRPLGKLFVTKKLQVSIIDVDSFQEWNQYADRKLYVEYDAFLDMLVRKFLILDKLLDPPYVLVQALAEIRRYWRQG